MIQRILNEKSPHWSQVSISLWGTSKQLRQKADIGLGKIILLQFEGI